MSVFIWMFPTQKEKKRARETFLTFGPHKANESTFNLESNLNMKPRTLFKLPLKSVKSSSVTACSAVAAWL